jgi:lipopolysaccharide export system protein LptC
MAADNLHSRIVGFLKVVLPLAALAILSTLFLVSEGVDPEAAIPYAEVDVADRLREPRVTDAAYAGVTEDGAALTLQAADARPGVAGTENAGQATGVTGRLETPDGGVTDLVAGAAQINAVAGKMALSRGVVLRSSTGYVIEMPGADIATDRTSLDSVGAVAAAGPLGDLTAGALHIGTSEAGYVVVFNGGVKLLYLPAK